MKTELHCFNPLRAICRMGYWVGLATWVSVAGQSTFNLGDLSLEQLMNESVTSVSKKETKLNQSPAAIAVVTEDDIRRLGITTFPEALRLVPGMDVARINGHEWAVSARGFNHEFGKKLLVLVDGRTIYTPSSAGVFWNSQDVVFEDIDRIEAIRGPGATLWGANAVNGVINITTKSARETQGGLVSTTVGTAADQPSATVRYGAQVAPDLFCRVYAKYFSRSELSDSNGRATPDAWESLRGGFRTDWFPTTESKFTLQGDYYRSEAGNRVNEVGLAPVKVQPVDHISHNEGNNILARWTRTFSPTSVLTVQTYYDHVRQGDGFGTEFRNTYDFDLQHQWETGEHHSLVWGMGYRATALRNTSSFNLTWSPEDHLLELYNLFVQDEIILVRDRLRFTVGSKFEHNNLTGWEIQPSARLLWTPSEHETVWIAVSRASRTPAVFERSARLNVAAIQPPSGPPVLVSLIGNPALGPERLVAYELGYRIQPTPRLSLDVAGFYNSYSNLISFVANPARFETTPLPAHVLISSTAQNTPSGETYGAELSALWQVADRWRLAGSYTWLHMNLAADPVTEGASPRQQFQVHSFLELLHHWELNGTAGYVGAIRTPSGDTRAEIPAHVRYDLGLVWHPTSSFEFGIWGQNLLDKRHVEFGSQQSTLLTEVPRGVTARVTWRF